MSASEDIIPVSPGDLPLWVHTAPTVCSNVRGRHKGFVVFFPPFLAYNPSRGKNISADRMSDVLKRIHRIQTASKFCCCSCSCVTPSSESASLLFAGDDSWETLGHQESG